MSHNVDRSWMRLPQVSDQWQKGLKKFMETRFAGTCKGDTAPCPCTRCRSMSYRTVEEIRNHLLFRGFSDCFIQGEGEEKNSYASITEGVGNDGVSGDGPSMNDLVSSLISGAIHGEIRTEEPNESAKKFFKLLTEVQKELYPGCKEATKVSFIVRLF